LATVKCKECGEDLQYNKYHQATALELCDGCYETLQDEQMFVLENAGDFASGPGSEQLLGGVDR
jgi:hypothetical protein